MARPATAKLFEDWMELAKDEVQLADFQCPLGGQIMEDPVTADDNFNYDRPNIENWLRQAATSPQTGKKMGKTLVPNGELRDAIKRFRQYVLDGNGSSGAVPKEDASVKWTARGQLPAGERSVTLRGQSSALSPPVAPAVLHMSVALSLAFKQLDPLRDLLCSVLDGLKPPTINVIGDESVGKSTILEMLAMLPLFPRKKRFCTRLAIHLRLRRDASNSATLSVYQLPGEGKELLLRGPTQLPQENGWFWVQEEMMEIVEELSAASDTGIVADKMIVLEVRRPDVPSIDLVDLPGLTTVPLKKTQAVNAILDTQLQNDKRQGNHNVYLAIVPAAGDLRPNTNTAMKFIDDHQLQKRTFGVFSKCDQVTDADILAALVNHENTEEGDSPESLGAVQLEKGQVATMLKPPSEPHYQVHNFERLLMQRKSEDEFFRQPKFAKIKGRAGMGALVGVLEKWYHEYLYVTWKDAAMSKVIDKLIIKRFELNMLGLVPEASLKDTMARQEVERRLGANSPYASIHHQTVRRVLTDVKEQMRDALLEGDTWDVCDLRTKKASLKNRALRVLTDVLERLFGSLQSSIADILSVESKVFREEEGDSRCNVVASAFDVHVRLFPNSLPLQQLRYAVLGQPFIQLASYPTFTSGVVSKCGQIFDRQMGELKEHGSNLIQRLVDPDSPWLRLTPEPLPSEGATSYSTQIKPVCDTNGFLDTFTALVLEHLPSPKSWADVHNGVDLGEGKQVALDIKASLEAEIRDIEAARDGIRRALSINDEEFAKMEREKELESEACTSSRQGLKQDEVQPVGLQSSQHAELEREESKKLQEDATEESEACTSSRQGLKQDEVQPVGLQSSQHAELEREESKKLQEDATEADREPNVGIAKPEEPKTNKAAVGEPSMPEAKKGSSGKGEADVAKLAPAGFDKQKQGVTEVASPSEFVRKTQQKSEAKARAVAEEAAAAKKKANAEEDTKAAKAAKASAEKSPSQANN